MKSSGAGAQAQARQLAQLLRIVELRIAAKWRELGIARLDEAQSLRELEEQRLKLERAETRFVACRESIAQVRRGAFSPFDARGHVAAQERLMKLRDKEVQATQVAHDKHAAARSQRERIESDWRRLRARRDALEQMHKMARKGAAIHAEMLQDVVQDEEFAARHAQPSSRAMGGGERPGNKSALNAAGKARGAARGPAF